MSYIMFVLGFFGESWLTSIGWFDKMNMEWTRKTDGAIKELRKLAILEDK